MISNSLKKIVSRVNMFTKIRGNIRFNFADFMNTTCVVKQLHQYNLGSGFLTVLTQQKERLHQIDGATGVSSRDRSFPDLVIL